MSRGSAWGSPQDLQSMVQRRRSTSGSFAPLPGIGLIHIYDANHYANLIDQSVVLAPGVSTLVLLRSPSPRNMMMLRNNSVGGAAGDVIYIQWDRDADSKATVALAPGNGTTAFFGTEICWDVVVPQNDMYAFCTNGATLSFAYSTVGET